MQVDSVAELFVGNMAGGLRGYAVTQPLSAKGTGPCTSERSARGGQSAPWHPWSSDETSHPRNLLSLYVHNVV